MTATKKIQKLTQSKFVRNVVIVASGTAMAQVVGVIFTPIITRIYGPEAFGLMGTFLSLATIAASVSALTYPLAIVLPKKDSDAKDIAKLSVYISIVTTSLMTLLILIAGDYLFALLGAQSVSAFALLIPLQMLLTAWLRVAQQWLIRKKQFKTTAKIEVIQSFFLNGAQTVIGFFKPIAAVLIVLTTLGNGLHVLLLSLSGGRLKKIKRQTGKDKKTTLSSLSQIAKKYYDFPLYRAPVVFIDDISASLPILMLSAFFGPVSAGYYVLGRKLLKAPSRLIGKSVSNVFYPQITEAAHKGKDLSQLIIKATLGLAAAGFFPYALIIISGPWLFKFIFGAEWTTAGEFARWISLWIFFQFLARPSGVAIITIGLQKQFLIYQIISTSLKIVALYAGYLIFKSDVATVALYSSAGALSLVVLIIWVITISKNPSHQRRFSEENLD